MIYNSPVIEKVSISHDCVHRTFLTLRVAVIWTFLFSVDNKHPFRLIGCRTKLRSCVSLQGYDKGLSMPLDPNPPSGSVSLIF